MNTDAVPATTAATPRSSHETNITVFSPSPDSSPANMSSAEATEPKVEETKPVETQPVETKAEESKPAEDSKPVTSSAVFSMFGGGAKKEKKDDEDRGDNSGSAKAQREAAEAAKGDDVRIYLFALLTMPVWFLILMERSPGM